jgi:hypothetical protein
LRDGEDENRGKGERQSHQQGIGKTRIALALSSQIPLLKSGVDGVPTGNNTTKLVLVVEAN